MLEAAERRGMSLQRTPGGPFQFPPALYPKVVGSMPTPGSAGSVPENLNLFPEPGSKSEETSKKQLSKDSILSLYGSQTPQMPTQGRVHRGPGSMPGRNGRPSMQELFVVPGLWHHTPNKPEHDFSCEATEYQEMDINVTQSHASVGSGLCEAWLGVWIWTLKGKCLGLRPTGSQSKSCRESVWGILPGRSSQWVFGLTSCAFLFHKSVCLFSWQQCSWLLLRWRIPLPTPASLGLHLLAA